jgi:ABC-2 type transport system permease protein
VTAASAIARKDWREFVRDRRLLVMAALVLLLAAAAVFTAYTRVSAYEADRVATERRDRVTWESQGERNPHSVAHFATWALRPLTALAVLEPGVTPYAGAAIWMEAHNQNGARARAVDDAAIAFDLGAFSVAWILQTIVPLLLFVIAAGLVARERERGTLRLLLVGGVDARGLLPRKLAGLGRVALLIAAPVLAAGVLAALLAGPADPVRLALWTLAYLVFLGVVATIAVGVSAMARTVSGAMLVLIGLWCVAVLLAPRAGAALAQAVAPTPVPDVFWSGMKADLAKAPDPFSDKAFEAEVLRRYGVRTVEELPVSFAGLQLDESEKHGNVVFDRHFGRLAEIYAEQRAAMRWASLLSPLPALQNVSTALAGTDGAHQLAFQNQAEAHRREMIGALNRDMVEHAAGEDFDYKAGPALWRETEDFRFAPPPLAATLRSLWPDLLILALWALGAALLLRAASARLTRSLV